jgi:hypothetical protein
MFPVSYSVHVATVFTACGVVVPHPVRMTVRETKSKKDIFFMIEEQKNINQITVYTDCF